MPSFTRESGGTLHVAVMGVNRIGKDGRALSADSEEKREPVRDIETATVESLKVLDTQWPIREADI